MGESVDLKISPLENEAPVSEDAFKLEGISASEVPESHPSLVHRHPCLGSSSGGEDVPQCVLSISKAAF